MRSPRSQCAEARRAHGPDRAFSPLLAAMHFEAPSITVHADFACVNAQLPYVTPYRHFSLQLTPFHALPSFIHFEMHASTVVDSLWCLDAASPCAPTLCPKFFGGSFATHLPFISRSSGSQFSGQTRPSLFFRADNIASVGSSDRRVSFVTRENSRNASYLCN
jgi:hypothetical protein